MTQIPSPREELLLRDLEVIKVYADQRRMQIIQILQAPTTVKAVAAAMQIAPSKLYYHIHLLVRHGLIEEVGQNLESGIVEKIYQASARQYNLINPLLLGDKLPSDAAATILSSLLGETHTEFLQAFAQRDMSEPTPPRHPFLSKKAFHLTNEQLTQLHQRLVQLIQDVSVSGETTSTAAEPGYTLTVAFYRQPS
jgi:DNA-binding transcriptional ArsR family regulator